MDTRKTGLLISSARKKSGITQKELAAKLHVSDRAVSKWERGAGFPDVTMLEPLSDALEIPVQALLSGEPAAAETASQDEAAVRDVVRLVYRRYRERTRQNIASILTMIFVAALTGFVLFGILDYSGAFLREISCAIPAVIYENGESVGETTVTVDGSIKVVGERNFFGTFHVAAADATGRPDTNGVIRWDQPEKGYQEIYFSRPGMTSVETGIQRYLYISPDMQHFALELEDGRIVATNAPLAELQAIGCHRYALSYDSDFYPYFSYSVS